MDKRKSTNNKSFRRWFKSKQERASPFNLNEFSAGEIDDGDDGQDGISIRSPMEMEPSTSTDELRIFVGTWNVAGRSPVGSLGVDLNEWLNLKDNAADIYVLGFQELVPLKTRNVIGSEDPTEAMKWNSLIGKTLNDKCGLSHLTPMSNPISSESYNYMKYSDSKRRNSVSGCSPMRDRKKTNQEDQSRSSNYKLMASKKMVGVFISVWMKRELLWKYCISNVKVCSVACGIMGYLGNKGSVSVSMSIEGTSFCFIAAHLASGEKKGDEGRRNNQVSEIFRRTSFHRLPQDVDNHHPTTILGHDRIFWCGDLNYRLYLEDSFARKLIKKEDWSTLQVFDQLQKEQEHGGVFQGWKEGEIEFAPTYKYSTSNTNRYSGGPLSRTGEKQRTPAWCDRILWYGKGVKQVSYFRSESKFSDHRPVSALFNSLIDVKSARNSSGNAFSHTIPPKQTGMGKNHDELRSTLLSLIVKDQKESR